LTKRSAVFGIGTLLMVIGFGGLALLRMGVVCPRQVLGPATELKLPEAAPQDSTQMTQPAAQDENAAPSGRTGQPPASAGLKPDEPISVPHLGGKERRYPAESQVEQQQTTGKDSLTGDVLGHNSRNTGPEPEAVKPDSKSRAEDTRSKSHAFNMYHPPEKKPVVVTFRFDPVRDRELYVARVHSGDRISMNVKRVGRADGRVYLTYTRNPDTREGALLKVRARLPIYRNAGYPAYDGGYYLIQMKIYPGNRWNIKPRSFV